MKSPIQTVNESWEQEVWTVGNKKSESHLLQDLFPLKLEKEVKYEEVQMLLWRVFKHLFVFVMSYLKY